ncbi:mRNA interferase YafO [Pseudomonas chlororaphis subsp. aurantiaca]|uniref:type II toxin-antitoxin system YafO family toxin n=1 Tax=Pseudomonas chlororaphis TaxID=587753 RepID=UPI0008654327|nr:type II toxin-antitoxin system YafO family toxin [Pseudomonas chlororaphis]BAV74168.1 mRNA interferase YafO [Pseudomonas chlororaphis subsp. aurantiaca]
MSVVVEFNPETYETLFRDVLADYPGLLNALIGDFTRYISSNRLCIPQYFGREAAYVKPEAAIDAGLMHIHIAIPPTVFPDKRPQHDRTCPMNSPHQDAALVYTQGLYEEDRYSLIAFLHPNAHGKAREREIMNYLVRVAGRFRDKY